MTHRFVSDSSPSCAYCGLGKRHATHKIDALNEPLRVDLGQVILVMGCPFRIHAVTKVIGKPPEIHVRSIEYNLIVKRGE